MKRIKKKNYLSIGIGTVNILIVLWTYPREFELIYYIYRFVFINHWTHTNTYTYTHTHTYIYNII
jgi:hypothetical protein